MPTFADRNYTARLAHHRSNWLQIPTSEATSKLLAFLESLTPWPHAAPRGRGVATPSNRNFTFILQKHGHLSKIVYTIR